MNKITFQDMTPQVYYNQSRDFQFIGRLFDITLNSVKTNAECLYNLPNNETMIDLLAMTLGFNAKHNYSVKQLTAICSAFQSIMRNKGSLKGIRLAIQALLNAEGITDAFEYDLEDNQLNLYLPEQLKDLNLLRDLLDYILPAGMSCSMVKTYLQKEPATTQLTTTDAYERSYMDNNAKAVVPTINDIETSLGKDTIGTEPGFFANTSVYNPTAEAVTTDNEEETE